MFNQRLYPIISVLDYTSISVEASEGRRAAIALAKMGDKRVVEYLLETQRGSGRLGGSEELWALWKIGPPAVDKLIAALDDRDQTIRYCAISALEEIGGSRAISALSRLSQYDSDAYIRALASKTVKKLLDNSIK